MAGKKTFAVGVKLVGQDAASRPLGRALGRIRTSARAATAPIRGLVGGLTSVKTLAAGIATGAVIGGLGRLVNSYASAADEIGKLSRQYKIGAEALQEWRHAATIAGADAATLDKGIEYLAKTFGEAKAGTGQLVTFLGKVSPALLQQVQAATDVDEAMTLAVKAMERIEDPTKRAALAAAFFGARAGKRLARLADEGSDGVARLREEARRYGLVSQDAADDAANWQDGMARLKLALGGVKNVIGSELLPVLQPMLQDFTEWIRANRTLIGQKIKSVILGIGEAIKSAYELVSSLSSALEGMGPIIVALAGAKYMGGLISSFGVAGTAAGAISLALASWGTAIYYAIQAWKEWDSLQAARQTNKSIDATRKEATSAAAARLGVSEDEVIKRSIASAKARGRKLTDQDIAEIAGLGPEPAAFAYQDGKYLRTEWQKRIASLRETPAAATLPSWDRAAGLGPRQSSALGAMFNPQSVAGGGTVDVRVHIDGDTRGVTVSTPQTSGAAKATMPTVRRAIGATP